MKSRDREKSVNRRGEKRKRRKPIEIKSINPVGGRKKKKKKLHSNI